MPLDEKGCYDRALAVSASSVFKSEIAVYLYVSASPKNLVTII